jgi:hypothetical protein
MLETLLAVLLGLAIRDLFLEAIEKVREYRFNKSMKDFRVMLEDWEADDDDV